MKISKIEFDDLPRISDSEKYRCMLIYKSLERKYPNAKCELNWSKPHELLIATILSAQATDISVNRATPKLFSSFSTPEAFANATAYELQPYIKTIGLYRNKSRSIVESMKRICDVYNKKVPNTMDSLLTLKGVARKTANVVLGNAFAKNEGVVVDTHVSRISKRLQLTVHTNPLKIEKDLMARFPRPRWTTLSHLLIFHGRAYCHARKPRCEMLKICQKHCCYFTNE